MHRYEVLEHRAKWVQIGVIFPRTRRMLPKPFSLGGRSHFTVGAERAFPPKPVVTLVSGFAPAWNGSITLAAITLYKQNALSSTD